MTSRALKIALAVSVALNVFVVVGGATAYVMRQHVEDRIEAQHRPGRMGLFFDIVADMDPAVRDRVRTALRASALAARPDFDESRTARKDAIALTRSPTLDQTAVGALLEKSRVAEMRGRARLEQDAVALLATLEPQDRQALSVILNRHGRGGSSGGGSGAGTGGGGDRGPRVQRPAGGGPAASGPPDA